MPAFASCSFSSTRVSFTVCGSHQLTSERLSFSPSFSRTPSEPTFQPASSSSCFAAAKSYCGYFGSSAYPGVDFEMMLVATGSRLPVMRFTILSRSLESLIAQRTARSCSAFVHEVEPGRPRLGGHPPLITVSSALLHTTGDGAERAGGHQPVGVHSAMLVDGGDERGGVLPVIVERFLTVVQVRVVRA